MKNCPKCSAMMSDAAERCPACAGKSPPPLLAPSEGSESPARWFWGGSAVYAALLGWLLAAVPNSLHGVPALVHTVKVGRGFDSMRAAESLSEKGPAGLAALLDLVDYPDPLVRVQAIGGIERIRPAPREAVPRLVAALDAGDEHVRESAALALQFQGPQAAEAVPALAKLLNGGNSLSLWQVRRTLERIGTPEAKAALAAERKP